MRHQRVALHEAPQGPTEREEEELEKGAPLKKRLQRPRTGPGGVALTANIDHLLHILQYPGESSSMQTSSNNMCTCGRPHLPNSPQPRMDGAHRCGTTLLGSTFSQTQKGKKSRSSRPPNQPRLLFSREVVGDTPVRSRLWYANPTGVSLTTSRRPPCRSADHTPLAQSWTWSAAWYPRRQTAHHTQQLIASAQDDRVACPTHETNGGHQPRKANAKTNRK